MQPDTLLITAFNSFLMAGLTALVWTRFNRLEDRFERVDARFDRHDDRFDRVDARFDQMAQLIAQCATRADVPGRKAEQM